MARPPSKLCGQVLPDVILMDLMMPDMDGATATRLIRQQYPKVQVVALTSFKEEQMVQNALQAGAIGYLLKDVSADELARAIRAAHSGRATLSPEAAQALVHAANQPPTPGHDLTERERDVLALMVEGLNNTQIASKAGGQPVDHQNPRQQYPLQVRRRQPVRSCGAWLYAADWLPDSQPGRCVPILPQLGETNTPRRMDAARGCLL